MQPYPFIKTLSQPSVQKFILENEEMDLDKFILSSQHFDEIPNSVIVDQIRGRRKAKSKFPEWYECKGIIYPQIVSIEQSSSQQTAQWKSGIFSGNFCLDLTGGMGIDSYYLSHFFTECIYVERDKGLVEIARHNHKVLGAKNILHYNSAAEDFLRESKEKFDFVYLDPSRRISNRKVLSLEQYEPNVIPHIGFIHSRSTKILIKTSPLLDIKDALEKLSGVEKVIVLVIENECKELLFQLGASNSKVEMGVYHLGSRHPDFSFSYEEEKMLDIEFSLPLKYLYEPNAGILKSGAFKTIAAKYKLKKLHPNTHLYTSDVLIEFPGRKFEVREILPINHKILSEKIPGGKANLSIRNFPGSVIELKKKLKIMDGGESYIFGTTLLSGEKKLLLTSKVKESI